MHLSYPTAAVGSKSINAREEAARKVYWSVTIYSRGFADVLTVQLLFCVTNEGSWKQMGNSIAEFCIINPQIILLPTILLLAWMYVQDIEFVGKECDSVENDEVFATVADTKSIQACCTRREERVE